MWLEPQGTRTRSRALLPAPSCTRRPTRPDSSRQRAVSSAPRPDVLGQLPASLPLDHQPAVVPAKELTPDRRKQAVGLFLLPPAQPPAIWSPPDRASAARYLSGSLLTSSGRLLCLKTASTHAIEPNHPPASSTGLASRIQPCAASPATEQHKTQ